MASSKRRRPQRHESRRRASFESRKQQENGGSKRRRVENDVDGDGWLTVTRRRTDKGATPSNYPSIRYHQNYKSDIRIRDLRDLALYVLTDDAVAPNWLAINKAKDIRKVVVLMVPGLDSTLLEDGQKLVKQGKLRSNLEPDHSSKDSQDPASSPKKSFPNAAKSSEPAVQEQVDIGSEVSTLDPEDERLENWFFNSILNVKAPGDAKQSRVHSSLQAMLLCNDTNVAAKPTSINTKNIEAAEPQSSGSPISDFVHTAEELREAGYPVHPATFTSQIDAELEAKRREATGQSIKDGWVDTSTTSTSSAKPKTLVASGTDHHQPRHTVYAVDCEMVLTSDNVSSLARVTLLSYPDGTVILDSYVKPHLPIINYFTQYSGITPAHLENVGTTLQDIQSRLSDLIDSDTILLGHSLESDLNALKMTHPLIIDTALIYPHPRGLPLRSSLKYLANKYLKREIQKAPNVESDQLGHDPREDARAVLDLVVLKCRKGPSFGTIEGLGEPIFKFLNRHGKTGAMIEYGTPERGFGKDARWTIGCQDDDGIVEGMQEAVNGDYPSIRPDQYLNHESGKSQNSPQQSSSSPAELPSISQPSENDAATQGHMKSSTHKLGGPIVQGGADFIWGRLRALEYARGWVTGLDGMNSSSSTTKANLNDNNQKVSGKEESHSQTKQKNPTDQSVLSSKTLPPESIRSIPEDQTTSTTLLRTLDRIALIRSCLPPRTLFIIFSGTGDVRPVLRLQALQQQYRKEFKTKKWDELSVRWTDGEEQELRQACEMARNGWGVVVIT